MKKLNRIKKIFVLLILIVVSLAVFACGFVFACRTAVKSVKFELIYQSQIDGTDGYDYIIVPGAAVIQASPGTQLKDRLDTALALYNTGAAQKIILSGGFDNVSNFYECDIMRAYLQTRGVPLENIICDTQGVDTAETLRRAKTVVGDSKAIVCTQSLYFERTAYLAKKFGLDVVMADSDIRIYTNGMGKARLRETVAAVKAVYDGNFVKNCRYSTTDYPLTQGDSNE